MINTLKNFRNPFTLWMAANILGFGLLGLAVVLIPVWLSQAGLVISLLIISVPASISQRLVLKKMLSFSWLWIIAMPVGVILAILLIRAIPESLWQFVDGESIAVLVALYLIIGFLIGFPQWLLLRRRFKRASLWFAATASGLTIGFGLVLLTNLINWSEFISYVLVVLIYATLTGYILNHWMSKRDAKQVNLLVSG